MYNVQKSSLKHVVDSYTVSTRINATLDLTSQIEAKRKIQAAPNKTNAAFNRGL